MKKCCKIPMELKFVIREDNRFSQEGAIEYLYFQCKKCGKVIRE